LSGCCARRTMDVVSRARRSTTSSAKSRSLNETGRDRSGNPVLWHQIYLARDLPKWRSRLLQDSRIPSSDLDALDRSLNRLTWTLYAMNSLTLINLGQTIPLSVPSQPKPKLLDHTFDTETWTPYPQQREPLGFHQRCHYDWFLSLAEIIATNQAVFISHDQELTVLAQSRFLELYRQLQMWRDNLPDCLQIHDARSVPHVTALQ
jgi:hypothetical protein